MGLFSLKVTCAICKEEVAFLKRVVIGNKELVCTKCMKASGHNREGIFGLTATQVISAIERKNESKQALEDFIPTKKVGSYVEFDTENEKWLVLSSFLGKRDNSTIYSFNEVLSFELLEDGESIASGGLGRALIGGAIFGGTGAIVGGVSAPRKHQGVCTSLKVKVTIDDVHNPTVYINLLETKAKKDGLIYKQHIEFAQECLSMFQLICDRKKNAQISNTIGPLSSADEIKKFKALLDEGVITEEEFNEKKKQLL